MAVDEAGVRAAIEALEVVVSWHSGNQKRKVQSIVDALKVAVGDMEPPPAEPVGQLETAETVPATDEQAPVPQVPEVDQ